ncbi:MAG TPA: low specificity L-threonine aldolase [Acidimicrobiales bacterium]|jgi:threonine aldolase|nr:low specificity L-threonine aldolase [Acidimicrobiales bacterium]HJM96984.1 low specificity L-threonine aldolase [Acidimicrobiales bacterium]
MFPEPPLTSFASDNTSGIVPEVIQALVDANEGSAIGYGDDPITTKLREEMNALFGREVTTLLAWGGTGANIVGLQAMINSWEAIICTSSSHINVDECGAPERFLGAKLIDLESSDAKIEPVSLAKELEILGVVHHAQPGAISITQSTEYGTLYTVEELKEVIGIAKQAGLRVHMDGARIANATAALGVPIADFTCDLGVDILSFGGTKNGMAYGEAIVVFNPELAEAAEFIQKQSAQLPSKMRYIAAQFSAMFKDNLWLKHASHANEMAQLLAEGISGIRDVEITQSTEVNAVFAKLPKEAIATLQEWSYFYDWEKENEVRWMTSYVTTPKDVERLVEGIHIAVSD